MRVAAVIAVVAVVSLVVLWRVTDGDDGPRGLIARLYLNDGRTSFGADEPIHMRLEITNYTGRVLEFDYEDGRPYDFFILEQIASDVGVEIWRWSDDNDSPNQNNQEWRPAQTVVFEGTWPQVGWRGTPRPGEYRAQGKNWACRSGIDFHCDGTAAVSFEIVP